MRRTSRSAGFTLVELLVVIGIIALLISVLLPALQSARKQANNVKCLSSLRQIGSAFEMYANEYKGYWPSARDRVQTAVKDQHAWTDLIAKYMTKQDFKNGYQSISDIRRNSVMWGCPEFVKSNEYDASKPAGDAENVYTGYAMQYYGDSDTYFIYGSTKNLGSSAGPILSNGTYTRPGYVKATIYKSRHAAEHGLIADSQIDLLQISNVPWTTSTMFWPYDTFTTALSPIICVEARHAKRGMKKLWAAENPSLNMLYCDGHAAPTSVHDAFRAVRSPGREKLPTDP